MITDITYLALDNTEKITIRLNEWEIIFHTLYTEQLVSTILNIYNKLAVFIPDSERASIQVNPSALVHSEVTELMSKPTFYEDVKAYAQAMKSMYIIINMLSSRYFVLCNKYNTKPLDDIATELCDMVENGCKQIDINLNKRVIDAQQCAAVIETLKWDW